MKPTIDIAKKVLTTVDAGLCSGLGERVPGEMCIEAAVCFAFDLPHGDNPPCVGSSVRSFKIALNDCNWSSSEARAKGMRKLAIAQLGSDSINQQKFSKLLAQKTIQKLLPKLFRQVAQVQKEPHKSNMLKAADDCEKSGTADAARYAARYAADAAARYAAAAAARYAAAAVGARYAAAAVGARYAAVGADADADAARYAADAARYAAVGADADAARYAADAARYAADAARYAAVAARYAAVGARYAAVGAVAAAAADADADADARDEYLILAADICLEVLIELKSPGCEWLHLCD